MAYKVLVKLGDYRAVLDGEKILVQIKGGKIYKNLIEVRDEAEANWLMDELFNMDYAEEHGDSIEEVTENIPKAVKGIV